jgi:hypothetical protein
MELIVDRYHPGTPESAWQQSGCVDALPPRDVGRPGRSWWWHLIPTTMWPGAVEVFVEVDG